MSQTSATQIDGNLKRLPWIQLKLPFVHTWPTVESTRYELCPQCGHNYLKKYGIAWACIMCLKVSDGPVT